MGISYEEATQPPGDTYKSPPSLARSAADWATSFIRGLAKGTEGLAGLPGDVSDLVGAGVLKAGHAIGLPDPPEASRRARGTLLPTSETIKTAVEGEGKDKNAVGKFLERKPETRGGRYAESTGEFVPAVLGGEGSLVRKGVQAVTGGVGSELAGELAKKYLPDHETASRVIGGLFGQGLPAIVRRAVAPTTISPEREKMVASLRKEGVEPTAGDVSGSRALKYAEHGLGSAPGAGGKYEQAREKIGEQFTSAVLKKVGENAKRATPEVVDRAFTRIGGDFDTLSARNPSRLDPQYFSDLLNAQRDYDYLFADPLKKPVVQKVVDHAVNQSGTMTGEQYQALRSRIDGMRRSYRSDPELQDFLGDVKKAMDDLIERNMARNNPADLGKWQLARRQYRNMLVLEKAATGASGPGGEAAAGIISPAKLRQALVAQSRRGYARGQGDFADLARAGEGVLKPPPTSGTTERAWVHAIPSIIGSGIGGAMAHGTPEALPAAFAGAFAPGMVGRGLMSGPAQGYLKNQIAASLRINPRALDALTPGRLDALVRAALAARSQNQGQKP